MTDIVKEKKLRHEYKYLLDSSTYIQLSNILRKVMKMDSNAKNPEGYHIRSLYFDDMYDTAMQEKLSGFMNRRKFRIRIYDFLADDIKLEEKIKYHDYIQKNTVIISREEYERIMDGDITFLRDSDNLLKKRYYYEIRNNLLRPKVIVDYFREAHVLPYNQIRITFDKNLSVAKPAKNIFTSDLLSQQIGREYETILEVKYNNFLPGYIQDILNSFNLNQLSVSKYLLCREHFSSQ